MSSESWRQERLRSWYDEKDARGQRRQQAREAYEFWNPPGHADFKRLNPSFDPTSQPGWWWNS